MKKILLIPTALCLLLTTTLVIGQNTRFSDPKTVVSDHFWGDLYANGGNSFFCNTAFTSKGFVLTDGYVYPLADVRSALDCGTSRECEQDNRYRQIASDMHNMIPVRSRTEMGAAMPVTKISGRPSARMSVAFAKAPSSSSHRSG